MNDKGTSLSMKSLISDGVLLPDDAFCDCLSLQTVLWTCLNFSPNLSGRIETELGPSENLASTCLLASADLSLARLKILLLVALSFYFHIILKDER